MAYKNFFYLDIETTSKFSSIFDLKLDDEIGYDLFIKKCVTMKKFDLDWNRSPEDLYIEKAPLLPEYGRIICMSFGMFTDEKKNIMTIVEDDEEILLKRVAKIITRAGHSKRPLCGYSLKVFDLPWLIKKMHKYEIDVPLNLNFTTLKPWEINVFDIADIWKGIGKSMSSMDEVMYDLGIHTKKIISGEDVQEFYWTKKDTKTIVNKCENDINNLILISEKLKL